MSEHLFLVNSEHFDVSFDETFKAMKFAVKEDLRITDRVKSGVIALSKHNYVFLYPTMNLPLISAPIDAGYLGDLTVITSRPVTLPKGFTFYLMELIPSKTEVAIPKDMKLKDPAYKDDIGRDAYLKKNSKVKSDIQFMLENSQNSIFFPRSSAAKKGYEVSVNNNYTTIRKSDLSILTNEEAYAVVQLVKGSVSKFSDKVEFVDDETAKEMLEQLLKKSDRGTGKEGSSDK